MPTQELPLRCTPSDLLAAGGWRRAFVFDGGGPDSWGSGCALLGHSPRATLRVDASGLATWTTAATRRRLRRDPLTLLDDLRRTEGKRQIDEIPGAFAGGLVAVLSYDLKQWVERLPCTAADDNGIPVLDCAWYDWVLVFDYLDRRWRLVSSFLPHDQLSVIGRELVAASRRVPRPTSPALGAMTSNFSREEYLTAVRRVLEYIAAGDVYQVNLAQRFAARWESPRLGSAASQRESVVLFGHLQRQHPMPYAAYVDCDDFAVVSNSPECFLSLNGGTIATFPIKGTRPRGIDSAGDLTQARALRVDPKEQAEHVMIVDLERNDLGRLCEAGSICVRSFSTVHSYPTLHHLVSEVRGRLRAATSIAEVLRATFPGGSITGAPKIRAMEIIDEIEPVRRGVYTGAIGFVGPGDRGTFNLAIRTATARGGRVTYHAGGGIVADSDPDAEYQETLLKARAFMQACGVREAA